MQVKRIFLASSEELQDDRRAFELMIGRINQQWRQRDIVFDLVVWENFIDAMSKEGLQSEYNKAIRECDIFVLLFFTKVGRYTLQEFETANAEMTAGRRCQRVYTYFRNDFILTGDIDDSIISLLEFKAKLSEMLGHYVTLYRNTEDLQWQFSRQLEMLYGSDSAASFEITDNTPQAKIDEAALVLGYRQLHGASALNQAEAGRLQRAVQRAGSQVRNAVFNLSYDVRHETWATDKHLMERTIPLFEALAAADPRWHAAHGQLGYALKDKVSPDWQRAKASLDRAVELRGERFDEGIYYQYNRALCAINLDPNYTAAVRVPAEAPTRNAVLEILKQARRELEGDWERMLQDPESADIRTWLTLNGSPRLR
ncbi:MAG: hypothetical protein KDI54_08515 [Gammaproteobacteria bacterium]|nr:hypothetical protein [Gammaproteobacteria bacterium]